MVWLMGYFFPSHVFRNEVLCTFANFTAKVRVGQEV